MYLIDTNVVSEARKRTKANPGVLRFFEVAATDGETVYLSSISIGELRRGVELIRHRGDAEQAQRLETWLLLVLEEFADHILAFDTLAAQVWGRLRVADPQREIDKQIAAVALVNGHTLVTRNTADFAPTGVALLNPFVTMPPYP